MTEGASCSCLAGALLEEFTRNMGCIYTERLALQTMKDRDASPYFAFLEETSGRRILVLHSEDRLAYSNYQYSYVYRYCHYAGVAARRYSS